MAAAAAALGVMSMIGTTDAFTTAPLGSHPFTSQAVSPIKTPHRLAPVSSLRMVNNEDEEISSKKSTKNPIPVTVSYLQDLMGEKPSAALVSTAIAAMLTLAPLSADAAMSGGRMGGSFSAPRSSGSYSRALPSSRSYSGGFSSGYRSGFGSGYYSRPSITVMPSVTPFYSPFYNPFFRPFGGVGVGTVGYTPNPFAALPALIFFGVAGLTLFKFSQDVLLGGAQQTSLSWSDDRDYASALGPGTSVVEVSVALEVPNRDDPNSILNALNRISRTARTDSRVGIQNLTSQVALELLRRKSSISAASTRSKHFRDRQKAERDYNQLSIKERSKFEQETLSKYGGVDYASSSYSGASAADGKATMAVVTIILAIDGDSTKLSRINNISDVEDALRRVATDAKVEDCLQSAEILWTPEDRSESLSMRDVVADYPELRTV